MFAYYKEKLFCPICKEHREEWAKSSGANYYINGHGSYIYYKETCSLCGKSYYLIAGNNGILEMRINGISLEDAIETRKKIVEDEKSKLYYDNKKRYELRPDEIDYIIKQCNEIYAIDEMDLVISEESINEADLTLHSCWMS